MQTWTIVEGSKGETKIVPNISIGMKYFVCSCTVTVNDNPNTKIKSNVNVSHLNLHIIVDTFNDT